MGYKFVNLGLIIFWLAVFSAAPVRSAGLEKITGDFVLKKQENLIREKNLLELYGQAEFSRCFDCPDGLENPFRRAACLSLAEFCLAGKDKPVKTCPVDQFFSAGRCVSMDDACRENYGSHAYFVGRLTAAKEAICECAAGYVWNEARTGCSPACPEGNIYYSIYTETDGEFLHGRCQTPAQICAARFGENNRFIGFNASGDLSCACADDSDWDESGENCRPAVVVKGVEKSFLETAPPSDPAWRARVSGRILLQVEDAGQAWYVYPGDQQRYYLGRPGDALAIMRRLGLGVSNQDFNAMQTFAPARLAGRILLKVEDAGQAYYVNPDNLRLSYLGKPGDALAIMRELGLGITNLDLEKIPLGFRPN